MNSAHHRILAVVAATTFVACSGAPKGANPQNRTLYGELGGVEGLRPIIDEWTWRLATDDVIGPTLIKTELGGVKEEALAFVCAVSGGPCLDSGERPLIAFSGSPSSASRRVVSHLRAAALARGVRPELVDRLVARIERDVRAFIGPPRG